MDRGWVKVNRERRIWRRPREAGIALLISIFILLLISVVAIALIVSSGTESALTGNYRSSTSVYYAALAGVEEVRARLRASDPNAFRKILPTGSFLPPPGTDLLACNPVYILNPDAGPVVTPWDPANPYYDTQYNQEFGATGVCATGPWPPSPSPSTPSVWNPNPLPFPAPAYKWVRINSITEQTLQLDVAPYDGTASENKLIYYDGVLQRLTDTQIPGSQVLEITALAVLPNGSQKLLQYLVAPMSLNLNFPSALTLDGNNPQFTASTSPSFWVKGINQGTVGSCNLVPTASHAVGYTDNSFTVANFQRPANPSGIQTGPPPTSDRRGNYMNGGPSTPDVSLVSLSSALGCPGCSLTTVGGLNALVKAITEDADVVVNGNATGSSMPSAMSATNPMTIVVNGDLTLGGWRNTGYGLLLVTGKFTYDPDAQWDGIILVIGKGWMYSSQAAYIPTQIQGAVLLSRTVDASGDSLPASSAPIFTPPSGGLATAGFDFLQTPDTLTNGIYYSNCWIQASQPISSYKVLSFHEISQ